MNTNQIALYATMSLSMATVKVPSVYVVHCNHRAFPFLQASEAYALRAHFEAVGLDTTIIIQESI